MASFQFVIKQLQCIKCLNIVFTTYGKNEYLKVFTSCTSKYKDTVQLKKKNNETYCFMQSGIPTYSMGTSSASSAKLKTYLIFWLNFELREKIKMITSITLAKKTDKIHVVSASQNIT